MTEFLVICSSKGGVGKTTTAINLGMTLKMLSKEVVIVDTNLSAPNLAIYLGAPNIPVTLHDVIDENKNIEDAIYKHMHGFKIIPASPSSKNKTTPNYDKMKEIIRTLHGKFDFVIIDSAAGLTNEALNSIGIGDKILVVSTPELPALSDALKTIKHVKDIGKNVHGIILTRVFKDELEVGVKDVEIMLESQVIGVIPEDEAVRKSVYSKTPVTSSHPEKDVSIAYKKLAAKLIGEKYVHSIEKDDSTFEILLKNLGIK